MDNQKDMNKKTIVVIVPFIILVLVLVVLGNKNFLGGLSPDTQTAIPPCNITSFTANPTSVIYGGSSTLSWTTNASCVSAQIMPIIGSVTPVGAGSTPTGPLAYSITYTLSAYNSAGNSTSATVNISVSGSSIPCPISTIPVPAGGALRFYEPASFNGGVTVGGYSPNAYSNLNSTGTFTLNIPAGSTILKAYLFAGRYGSCSPFTVTLSPTLSGSSNYTFNSSNQISPTFQTPYGGNSGVHAIDVTSSINPAVNSYSLFVPGQLGPNFPSNRYEDFSLYVAFSKPSLPLVHSAIFINGLDSGQTLNHTLNFTQPISNTTPVALSLMASYFCNNTIDSEVVKLNTTTTLGTLWSPDANSGYCGGPLGSFSYSNNTLTALSDDNNNWTMNAADALSDISTIISNNITSFTLNFLASSLNNSNTIWAEFVTYRDTPPAPTCNFLGHVTVNPGVLPGESTYWYTMGVQPLNSLLLVPHPLKVRNFTMVVNGSPFTIINSTPIQFSDYHTLLVYVENAMIANGMNFQSGLTPPLGVHSNDWLNTPLTNPAISNWQFTTHWQTGTPPNNYVWNGTAETLGVINLDVCQP